MVGLINKLKEVAGLMPILKQVYARQSSYERIIDEFHETRHQYITEDMLEFKEREQVTGWHIEVKETLAKFNEMIELKMKDFATD